MSPENPVETQLNLIAEGTHIEGKIRVDRVTRAHGTIRGEVQGSPGSTLIVGETGVIEGKIKGDTIFVDGFVQGEIVATTRVVVSSSGRVVGHIHTPSLTIQFGAYFEGSVTREGPSPKAPEPSSRTQTA